jgi:hypothetical protein
LKQSNIFDQQHQELVFHLITQEKKTREETITELVNYGIDPEHAVALYENVSNQIKEVQNKHARKEMLYGGLWFTGGTIFTIADTGFIFWGAIVFGGYQFLKGYAQLK